MANWYKEVFRRDDPDLRSEVGRLVSASRQVAPAREAGAVVEFVREGQLLCGAIRGRPSNRATAILIADGREVTVRGNKIVHVSSERVAADKRNAAVRDLARLDGQRDWASRGVDVGTLWAVAREHRGDEAEWSLDDLAQLNFGDGATVRDSVALLRALWRGEWFARRGLAWRLLAEEVVDARQGERQRRDQGERRSEELGSWLRHVADGLEAGPPPEGVDEAVALLEEAALYGSEAPRATDAARLMKAAHLHGAGAAFDVLVKLRHWSADENLDLRRCGAPLEFGAAASEAEALARRGRQAWPVRARRRRRVWFGRPVGLIAEGEQCLLAVGVRRWPGGWRAAVYVPAVAMLVPDPSQTDEEARARGVALRLPDQYLPMVPEPLLEVASLTTDGATPCLVIEIDLGRDLKVRRSRLYLRRVRLRALWRDGDAATTEGGALLDVAWALRQGRLDRDAVIFPARPRPCHTVRDGAGLVPPPGAASAALDEYALLASRAAAGLCQRQAIPAVYRVQAKPAEMAPRGSVLDVPGAHLQARALPRTVLQTEAGPLGGMGLEMSVPVANPAESYVDLVMQRQLLAHLGHGAKLSEDDLRHALADTSAAREAATEVRRSARRYWLLKVLEGSVGQRVPAVVLERAGLGYVVELTETGCRDYVPVRDELAAGPGDRIEVVVEQASARRNALRLSRPRVAAPAR